MSNFTSKRDGKKAEQVTVFYSVYHQEVSVKFWLDASAAWA